MSDLRKKNIKFDEKKDVSHYHNNNTDAIELQSKDAENELFKKILLKSQGGDYESKEAQKESELKNNIEKKVRISCPDLKIVKMGKTDEAGREGNSDIKEFSLESNIENNKSFLIDNDKKKILGRGKTSKKNFSEENLDNKKVHAQALQKDNGRSVGIINKYSEKTGDTIEKREIFEFDIDYKEKLFEFIEIVYNNINISNKDLKISNKSLRLKAETLFDDACQNGLTRKILHNQDLRYPEKFAIVLAYYPLLLSGIERIEGKNLYPSLIYNKVKTFLDKRGISTKAKRPQLLTGFLYDYLSPDDKEKLKQLSIFKSRKEIQYERNVIRDLEDIVKILDNPRQLNQISNLILKDLFNNNFKRLNVPTSYRKSINLARIISFFALRHNEYTGENKRIKPKDFLDLLDSYSSLTSLKKNSFYVILPIAYQFLSIDIKKCINYLPSDLSIVDRTILEGHLRSHFNQMVSIFGLKSPETLKSMAKSVYKKAINNGFSFKDLPCHNVQYLSAAFLFLSIQKSKQHSNISRRSIIRGLNKMGYSITEHSLGPILQYLNKFVREDIDFKFKTRINSNYFEENLGNISLEHKTFNRVHASFFSKLILTLFKSSRLEPQNFAEKLGIYSSNPSHILERIGKDRVLTRVDVFLEMEKKIKKFIKKYVPNKDKKDINFLLSRVVDYFKESKKLFKHRTYLKVKERRKKYGENYKSTTTRIKRLIIMLGFSPYDGYDFIENQYRDKYNKIRINAHFHHLDYNPNNDNDENLVFLPSKHPRDTGRKINYITHDKISGLEATLKDRRTTPESKKKAQKTLKLIEQRTRKNATIITQAFYSKDEQILDDLIEWNINSLTKIKKRLRDLNLAWTLNLNKLIPTEKYGKRISDQEYKRLKKNIN